MCIDPLAEKYPYNSTYAFQENKMGMGRELEGLELVPWGLLGTTEIIRVGTDITGKTSEVAGKTEIHHLIPRAAKGNDVVKQGIEEGFKFEGAENKMPLEKFSKSTGNGRHGNHPSYNKGVLDKLGEFGKTAEGSKTTEGSKTALEFLRNLTQELKETIKNNPDKKINDVLKSETSPTVIDNTAIKKPELPKPVPKPKPDPNQIMI
ncbi:AHH domain-containing protein [Flavobacterium aestivum]|uniref:AHH domain-containing protein n=1 Tax=Flavobacterium aestivum TaxID=3003257 RepID=UPI002285DDEE|nr:AHH domain-containing protein [Flavobacterium aestivum]